MFLISNFLMQTTSTTTRRPTTTTTTTIKPRLFNYYEEGGWRILRQEEEKKKHKYDFLYHTENGIYGEEKANLHPGHGTSAQGYYEYTGDDGELYRVNYKSDHRGFIPEGDHIPTPPPVPDAIKRALEYVAKKKETHGAVQTGQYEHKTDPIRRQNMPTSDRPLNLPALPSLGGSALNQPQPQQPKPSLPALPSLGGGALSPQPQLPSRASLPPLPTLPPLGAAKPRFTQYSGSNQYNPLPTIVPQNAPQGAYQLPSLSSQRPADQLIQQTQLTQQLPQVQVLLPQVHVAELSTPAPLVQKIEVQKKATLVGPVAVAAVPISFEQQQQQQPQPDQPQLDQPQADQPQADQPQADQPQADQPQDDQPQADQPQADQPQPEPEMQIGDDQNAEQLNTEQSIESIVVVKPDDSEVEAKIEPEAVAVENQEISAAASEVDAKIEPEAVSSENQEVSAEASEVDAKIEPEAVSSESKEISAEASEVDAKIEPEVAASENQEVSAEVDAKIEPEAISSKQEISAEASETENTFQPPYQVPEELKDKEDFELITA